MARKNVLAEMREKNRHFQRVRSRKKTSAADVYNNRLSIELNGQWTLKTVDGAEYSGASNEVVMHRGGEMHILHVHFLDWLLNEVR